jgi:uncharacterized protein VirK/YbjX
MLLPKPKKTSKDFNFWLLSNYLSLSISVEAFVRCIDLFYLILPYLDSITTSKISIHNKSYTTKKYMLSLLFLAQTICNDYRAINTSTHSNELISSILKLTNGTIYRYVWTDFTDNAKDILYLIKNYTHSLKTYEDNHHSKVSSSEREIVPSSFKSPINQITTLGEIIESLS